MQLLLSQQQVKTEVERITRFLKDTFSDGASAVIGVSGGLDSDVAARLTCAAVGSSRLKLFIVRQKDMESRHLTNARQLAADLEIKLVEIPLEEMPEAIISALSVADPESEFMPHGLLDPNRMKCSLRTTIISAYQDRGYVVVGTSNRTELETGFFLPFGDGIWHVGPIVHLYKSQVRQLAETLGVRRVVIDQPASAGFWAGQEDLEDLSFWLFNDGPIGRERDFDENALAEVRDIRAALTTENVDWALLLLSSGEDETTTCERSGLPLAVIQRLQRLTAAAKALKMRPFGTRLEKAL